MENKEKNYENYNQDEFIKLQNSLFLDIINSINFDVNNIYNFDIVYINNYLIYSFNINDFENVIFFNDLSSKIILINYTKNNYIYFLNTMNLYDKNISLLNKLISFIFNNMDKINKIDEENKLTNNNSMYLLLYKFNKNILNLINNFNENEENKNNENEEDDEEDNIINEITNYEEFTKEELLIEIDKALDNKNETLFKKLTEILNKKVNLIE